MRKSINHYEEGKEGMLDFIHNILFCTYFILCRNIKLYRYYCFQIILIILSNLSACYLSIGVLSDIGGYIISGSTGRSRNKRVPNAGGYYIYYIIYNSFSILVFIIRYMIIIRYASSYLMKYLYIHVILL